MVSIKEVKNHHVRWLLSGKAGDAEARAVRLLVAHLTPKQRKRYLREGEFVVRGSKRGRYVIRHGRKMVHWLPLWPILPCLRIQGCLHAYGAALTPYRSNTGATHLVAVGLPYGDQLLALKLLLETDEKHFRAETIW